MDVISRAAAAEDDLLVPVGFRFHPTDEELVTHYLKKKLKGMDSHVSNIIREVDILKFEPWDLPERSLLKSDDENWFFFSRPEYSKHKKNRTTQEGFWKITGREHAIKARDNKSVIGRKRILTFYRGRVRNSEKTNWVMHEYYIPDDNPNAQRDFVLCRIKRNVKKSDENTDVATTCDEGETSTHNAFDVEIQPIHGMDIPEEATQQPENLDYFERARDRWLASSSSNKDHNATFADYDSDSEFEVCLRTFNTKPFHAEVPSLQMLYELEGGSSQSIQDTNTIFHNRSSRQAASSVNVAPKPRTHRVQLKSGTSHGAHGPGQQSNPIFALRNTSADEYYSREKTRSITYAPAKPKAPAYRRTAADLAQKQISITESSIDKKVPQSSMEQTHNRTNPGNCKGSFITWQTSPWTSLPSVCIFKTVLGTILFLFCVREVVLYGEWC